MAAMQRRLPCFVVTQKLQDAGKKFRFIFPVMSVFFLCFFLLYFFCFVQEQCCFFCLLLFVAILTVFVCPFWSFSCTNFAAVLELAVRKFYSLDLAFSRCVFLTYFIFSYGNKRCLLLLQFCCCVSWHVSRSYCSLFFCFLLCLFCPISSKIYSFDIVYFCCVNNIVFVVFWGLLMLLLFPLGTPPWPYVSNNAPPAFSYAPCHPLFVSLCSITLLNTLLTHLRACAPSSRVHIWLCLCWCLCVFLRGCWPHCVPVPLWLWLRLLVGLCLFIFIISSLSIISTYLS